MEKKIRDNGNPEFNRSNIRISLYRPFIKQYLYLQTINLGMNTNIISPHSTHTQTPRMLLLWCLTRSKSEFSTIITDITPDLHNPSQAPQCFPMRAKKQKDKNRHVVGSQSASQPVSQSAISHREPGDNSSRQDQGRILSIHNGNNHRIYK